ncbi:MAG: lysophospholipid acyltransferase family protein [Candidatus Thiodiazotropha sp.]
MILIRSIIYFILLMVSTIILATVGTLVGWALPKNGIFLFDHSWSRINLWGLKHICGLTYRLEGREHIPEGSCIIFAKHQSAWETIALISLLPGPKSWVLKRELFLVPFMGWIMVYFKPIAIDRKSGQKAVDQIIEQGIQRLEAGKNVFIFPEGTRVAPGARKRYGKGGALLAEKSGYPVLPVAHNAGVFWRRRDIRKYPGTIDVRIGPIIETKGLSASEINRKAEAWIETTVDSLPKHWDQ